MKVTHKLLALLAVLGGLGGSLARAAAPEISDPNGRLIAGSGFDAPGTFPTSVTAANILIQPQAGAEYDGPGEDILKVQFPAAGPIKWTSSRYNSGDFALSIGPLSRPIHCRILRTRLSKTFRP